VAAYFYLRVAVLMYAGGGLGESEGGTGGSAQLGGAGGMTGGGIITAAGGNTPVGGLAWATPAAAASTVTTINEQILLDDETAEGDEAAEAERVPVPALAGLAIGLCTGVTVLFGVWPQPLIDFANHATLLFLPK
jgi:NADH:ubiquinone oxidoreductase subunit 2 (subunit N)